MALSKSGQLSPGPTPCAAGATVLGTAYPVNYGVSGVARILNGANPPATACGLYLDFSADGSTWVNGPLVGLADTVASSISLIPFAIGIGAGADWAFYRVRFSGNTTQPVTVQADASTTTAV
ncbi:MAG: hypothetical protein U0800_09915 [Isosphaeraceae bacterium]